MAPPNAVDEHAVQPCTLGRSPSHEKDSITKFEETSPEHEEDVQISNLEYTDDEHEPEIHLRTWIALLALCTQSFCQLWSLLGPPAVLGTIVADVDGVAQQAWVASCPVLVQAAFCSILSSASDLFQARKLLLVACTTVAFIGAAIAPGSQSVGRLIAAQSLIGAAMAVIPLTFVVPSEILPIRWRPMAQAMIQTAGALGMIAGPLCIGALSQRNPKTGWRTFFWIETGLWGASALFLVVGYRPPKRHTRLDHLSFWQKIAKLDLVGALLLVTGLTLLLAGLNLGGAQFAWTAAPVLSTLLIGIFGLVVFGVYEWKGTKTGILHHDLFTHSNSLRTFMICLVLMFAEGVLVFSFILFYPVLTQALFEPDLLRMSARVVTYYASCCVGTIVFGYMSVKLRSIREALLTGFALSLIGVIGMTTIQPGQNASSLVFAAFGGFGTAAVLSQAISGVQLASPHSYLATATALAVVSRAVSSTTFTSIYSAVVTRKLGSYIPTYVATAAVKAGLPATSIPAFVQALAARETEQLGKIPGVSPEIIQAGVHALKQAYADAIRNVFIIAVPFVLVATVLCWWLGDLRAIMSYHVEAPVEELHAKGAYGKNAESA